MDAPRLSDPGAENIGAPYGAAGDIFILGPARSGTSWLQTMLAEHPDVASPPETELFSGFLVPMERTWQRQRAIVDAAIRSNGTSQLAYGLATVLDDAEFVDVMRSVYAAVRGAVLSAKPGASRFLEKTPDHALFIDVIRRVVPDARLVMLVRDPRDTVRSLLEASAAPWGHWAPSSLEDAVSLWLRNVRKGLAHRKDARMTVVRYEDLRDEPAELGRVAEFLGLGPPETWLLSGRDAGPGARGSMVVRGDAAALGVNPYDAPAFSFHDRGRRRELDRYERAYVVWRCRAEMELLGYDVDEGRTPAGVNATRAVRSLVSRARRRPAGAGQE